MQSKIKNYSSTSPLPNIFNEIEKQLTQHGARSIVKDYDGQGMVQGIAFTITTPSGNLTIRMPARVDKVKQLFKNQGINAKPDQAYRTAWATIRDWIKAQMALLDWDMVKLEEVFLPYAVTRDGATVFEQMENRGYNLLAGGTQNDPQH